MNPEGTITLRLRAEDTGSAAIGDAQFSFAPDHSDYHAIIEHVGGLAPGESKPVPPWPDNSSAGGADAP